MANKKGRRKKSSGKKPVPQTNDPWLSKRTGFLIVGFVSLILIGLITWQLESALGLGEALLWGVGFGIAIWAVFFLAYSFNRWVRRS